MSHASLQHVAPTYWLTSIPDFVESITYRMLADGMLLQDIRAASTQVADWAGWGPFWLERAREHEAVGERMLARQYRVTAGDTLEIERLAVEAGQPFTFDRVLLVNNDGKVTVGSPTVAQASVVADVVAHKRGPKTIAFKMKRRKGYHKTIGHRQELTVVKIKEIKA